MVDAEKIKAMFNGERIKPLIILAETYAEFQVWCWDHEIEPRHPFVTFIGASWYDLYRLRGRSEPLYAVSSWPRWPEHMLRELGGYLQVQCAIELQGDELAMWILAANDQRPGLRRQARSDHASDLR